MMTKVDDISVGDFIVITEDKHFVEFSYIDGFIPRDNPRPEFDGSPAEVVAIGLPFLVVSVPSRNNAKMTLDVRKFSVQKVPTDYVKALLPTDYVGVDGTTIVKDIVTRSKICPECGGDLVESRLLDLVDISTRSIKDYHSWAFKCTKCSFIGIKRASS